MSRKGRRGRSRSSGAKRAGVDGVADVSPSTPPDSTGTVDVLAGSSPPSAPDAVHAAQPPAAVGLSAEANAPAVAQLAEDDAGPPSGPGPEEKTPGPSSLDVLLPAEQAVAHEASFELLFFDELPAESWLAHELELRDPRAMLKMTETVARRRAHFAKYVVGIVGFSALVCLVAAIKAAVPSGNAGYTPAVDQLPAAQPAAAATLIDRSDGGW